MQNTYWLLVYYPIREWHYGCRAVPAPFFIFYFRLNMLISHTNDQSHPLLSVVKPLTLSSLCVLPTIRSLAHNPMGKLDFIPWLGWTGYSASHNTVPRMVLKLLMPTYLNR
jgi:hypothetical protein